MAALVGAVATSHKSDILTRPDTAPAAHTDPIYAAMADTADWIADHEPDALVVIGTDHFNTFFVDDLPSVCVGVGQRYQGWADNIPMFEVPGSPSASRALAGSLRAQGIDEVRTRDDMRLDHSFFEPLYFLWRSMSLPVIPIFQNCIAEPFLAPARAADFGSALRVAIEAIEEWDRVVLIGSGGLSHWIGGPEHRQIAPDFDRRFLDDFATGITEPYTEMSSDALAAASGNGGHELRNWMSVRACAPDFDAQVRCYEAVREWGLGFALATLAPPAQSAGAAA